MNVWWLIIWEKKSLHNFFPHKLSLIPLNLYVGAVHLFLHTFMLTTLLRLFLLEACLTFHVQVICPFGVLSFQELSYHMQFCLCFPLSWFHLFTAPPPTHTKVHCSPWCKEFYVWACLVTINWIETICDHFIASSL